MSADPTAPILAALETLLEELDTLFDRINEDIKTATYASDYDRIKELADNAKVVKDYRSRLSDARKPLVGLELAEAISKLLITPKTARPLKTSLTKTSLKKSARGVGTPQSAYYLPILQALTELGGRGTLDEVYQRVEQFLKDELKTLSSLTPMCGCSSATPPTARP